MTPGRTVTFLITLINKESQQYLCILFFPSGLAVAVAMLLLV